MLKFGKFSSLWQNVQENLILALGPTNLDTRHIQCNGCSFWELENNFFWFKVSQWKTEILFHYIFQEKDPLRSLDDILPGVGREGRVADVLRSFSSMDIGSISSLLTSLPSLQCQI